MPVLPGALLAAAALSLAVPQETRDLFATGLTALGDLDGDGVSELAVVDPGRGVQTEDTIWILSGADRDTDGPRDEAAAGSRTGAARERVGSTTEARRTRRCTEVRAAAPPERSPETGVRTSGARFGDHRGWKGCAFPTIQHTKEKSRYQRKRSLREWTAAAWAWRWARWRAARAALCGGSEVLELPSARARVHASAAEFETKFP